MKRPRKGSADEITDRRQAVIRLRLRGMGYRAIAKELGVGHMTVKRDLEVIAEETRGRMGKMERDYVLAQSLSVYEEIETQAWDQFSRCAPGSTQRANFLHVVRSARNDQTKLLMDIGLIQKTPQEVKHLVTSKVIESWTPAAQDLIALAIIKAGLTPTSDPVPDDHQLPANIPSVIDVTEEEERSSQETTEP
jgi:hypothetical protein